eukprot:maker-scaffold728_size105512-snap-gene-0.18 protein:Tk02788 transcript:maker-scaffold728_size105512-snap-gene-0.18-mRNA-1 annotation:"cd63 antigen"
MSAMPRIPKVSSSSGRLLILLIASLLLMALGIALIVLGSILLGSFKLHHLSFASGLFRATPILIILSGVGTTVVAVWGVILWHRQEEVSFGLRLFSFLLLLSCLLCVIACILSFLLREVAAVHFPNTNVLSQLRRFEANEVIRHRWNSLQRAYQCCGGHEQGYRDWTPNSGLLKSVPDSCCQEEFEGCGLQLDFNQELAVPRVDNKINVEGCMPVIKAAMRSSVLPILMACALLALVAALIELLLMLCAFCFADHVKKMKDTQRSHLSLATGHPGAPPVWARPLDRLNLPVLDASPSLKQNRQFFPNQSDSPEPAPSLISSSSKNDESLYDQINSPAHGNPGLEGASGRSKPPSTGFFSKWFGREEPRDHQENLEMDSIYRRKEALYNDALDREYTLMGVLKNVSAKPSEAAEDIEKGEGHPRTESHSSKKGFSFFGFKSKSRDNVLASDSKLDKDGAETRDDVNQTKALSLDNLAKKDSDHSRGFHGFLGRSKDKLNESGQGLKSRRNSDAPKSESANLKARSRSHDEVRSSSDSSQYKLKLPAWLSTQAQPKRGDTVDDRANEPGFEEIDLKTPEIEPNQSETENGKKYEESPLRKFIPKWSSYTPFVAKTKSHHQSKEDMKRADEDYQSSQRFEDTSKSILTRGVSPIGHRDDTIIVDSIDGDISNKPPEEMEISVPMEPIDSPAAYADSPLTTGFPVTSKKTRESRKLKRPTWMSKPFQAVDAAARIRGKSADAIHSRNEDDLRSRKVGSSGRRERSADDHLQNSLPSLNSSGPASLLPQRKPTIIGSTEDILDFQKDASGFYDKNLNSDEWDEGSKVRVSGFGLNKAPASGDIQSIRRPISRPVHQSDEERIAKIESEVVDSKPQSKKKVSYADEATQSDPRSGNGKKDHDFMNHIKKGNYYGQLKIPTVGGKSETSTKSSPDPTERRSSQTHLESSKPKENEPRTLSDHDFMKHIEKSGYYGNLKVPSSQYPEGKWKEDKVTRLELETSSPNPYETNWSDMKGLKTPIPTDAFYKRYTGGLEAKTPNSKDTRRKSENGTYSSVYDVRSKAPSAEGLKQKPPRKSRRSASASSISSVDSSVSSSGRRGSSSTGKKKKKGDLHKLKNPQFYLDKTDGRILAAFETEVPARRRGRSMDNLDVRHRRHGDDDDLYLPFGTTEYWIQEVDRRLQESRLQPTERGHRAKSEPRNSRRTELRISRDESRPDRRAKSTDRFSRSKRPTSTMPSGEPPNRAMRSLDRHPQQRRSHQEHRYIGDQSQF